MSRRFIIRDPLALHREGVLKSRGLDAWSNNVYVAVFISEILKPCLGPKGMSKLVVDKFNDRIVTSHGAAILDKMDIHHPVAKVLKETSRTVDITVGDGTKTTIILIGELLKKAENLITKGIKINTIAQGYRFAYYIALKHLREISKPLNNIDNSMMQNFVSTLFTSRSFDNSALLSELASKAIVTAIKKQDGKIMLDKDAVKIVKKIGAYVGASRIFDGIVIDKEIAHPTMPRIVENARIAVLNMALKLDEFKHLQPYKYHIDVNNPNYINAFLKEEENIIKKMVDTILSTGANVIICRKKIGAMAKQMLVRKGVMGISRLLNEETFTSVAKVTGAKIVSNVEELTEKDLGRAAIVKEEKFGNDKVLVIEGCSNFNGTTLLLRAMSENILNDLEHAIKDSITYVYSSLEKPAYLPGGGAVEEALATTIIKEALNYSCKEQEAMLAFANCLETIPRLLAENSGHDPIDILTQLRSRHEEGQFQYGVNVFSGRVTNVFEAGVLESYAMKEQILKTVFETTVMLLRVDEVVDRRYAKRHKGELGGQ